MRPAILASLLLASASFADFTPAWNQAIAPFHIAGNLNYVGTNYLASYLISTPAGHILINPDYEESVPLIEHSVEKLGLHFSDIKIILISHAHDDHAAGCALAKKLSGAKLMVMDADVAEIEHGGAGDFQYKQHWTPVKVDRILHDSSRVELGGTTLVAHLTPGHTKGCTTWTMDVKEAGKLLQVVIVGSPNVNSGYKLVDNEQYPQIAADYEKCFRVLRALPCDIFLGSHGGYFDLNEKLKRMTAGEPNPFIDGAGYRAFVEESDKTFREKLAAQQSGQR